MSGTRRDGLVRSGNCGGGCEVAGRVERGGRGRGSVRRTTEEDIRDCMIFKELAYSYHDHLSTTSAALVSRVCTGADVDPPHRLG